MSRAGLGTWTYMALVLIVTACAGATDGTSNDSEQEVATTSIESSVTDGDAGGTELADPFSVVYDGEDCTSTLPERVPAQPLIVELRNESDTTMEFIIGYYDEGFGRDDMIAHLEERKGQPIGPPGFANDVFTRSVRADMPFSREIELDPERYYTICLVMDFTEGIVLSDLVVEE